MKRIRDALARLLVRGILLEVEDDSAVFQRLKVKGLAGEVMQDVQRLQPWGFISRPPEDGKSQVLLAEVGASREHVVALNITHEPSRPNIAAEESAQHGKGYVAVLAKPGGGVEIGGAGGVSIDIDASGNVTINNGNTTINGGDITLTGGNVSIGPNTTIDGKPFLTHTHSGVTPGGGSTGPVV
jgi:phage baseplate assembly protein V